MNQATKLAAPILTVIALTTGCTEPAEVKFPEEPGRYVMKQDGLLVFREVYHDGMYFEDRQSSQNRNTLEKCGYAATRRVENQIELMVQSPQTGCRFSDVKSYSVIE